MLFLFSDVGEKRCADADPGGVAPRHRAATGAGGRGGADLEELAADGFAGSADRPEALATGEAGTVYLCHPFLVHSAQPHRGTHPRFMARAAAAAG